MSKSFFKIFGAVFSVVGAVIGAGFITGGEIAVFFLRDFSLSGVYSAFIFFAAMIFTVGDDYNKVLSFTICFADIVVLGCMFSAVDELSAVIFGLSEKLKIFKIILAILTFFISNRGMKVLSRVSAVITPLVILSVLLVVSRGTVKSIVIAPSGLVGALMPLTYAAANYLLIYPVIVKTCGKLCVKIKLLVAILSSAIIFSLVFFVGANLSGVSDMTKMPLLTFAEKTPFSVLFKICCFCAVFTASVSSSYSAYSAFGYNDRLKFLACLTALALSEAGFSAVIGYLYPILGAVGAVVGAVNFSRIIFPLRRLKRTSAPPKYKVLRYSPLRDRV